MLQVDSSCPRVLVSVIKPSRHVALATCVGHYPFDCTSTLTHDAPGALMAGAAGKVETSCLLDPDQTRSTISLQMCGNGIVEKGEDCDPGMGIESPCCDSATCKFKGNAVCDPDSSPCCTSQCTFAPANTVCRPSKDDKCDTPETCTGTSSACPADVMAPNGENLSKLCSVEKC